MSFMFLFLIGCNGEESVAGYDVSSALGVKVLSKPIVDKQFFKDAVGDKASENFYNIFASQTIAMLYDNYMPEQIEDNQILYLFDSLRYTISRVTTNQGADGTAINQTITVDFNKNWNWSVPLSLYEHTIFDNFTKSGNNTFTTPEGEDDWISIVELGGIDYSQYYYGKIKPLETDPDYADYYTSPSYPGEGGEYNYYQDALEYATYLFVLGFDYKDENGNLTDENDYFDFNIDLTRENPILVKKGINGQANITIQEALAQAKDLYVKTGDYIGLNPTNRKQIHDFILDKVIGVGDGANDSPNKFEVTFDTLDHNNLPVGSSTKLEFNRDYDKIVENIIEYACKETRIGGEIGQDEKGNPVYLTLENDYRISKITDYSGDSFSATFFQVDKNGNLQVDENGKLISDDGNMFAMVPYAEYQSLAIMPKSENVESKRNLTEIILAFEYFDDPSSPYKDNSGKIYDPNGLDLNVGFRFYDYSENTVKEYTLKKTFNIPYGKYNDPKLVPRTPDEHWVFISVTEGVGGDRNLKIGRDIFLDTTKVNNTLRGMFNNDIGGGVINASKYGVADDINPGAKSIFLNGNNDARNYYISHDSKTYGTYATLNPAMFAGADGCDYIEVYFDILKDKNNPNKNYNFKVVTGLVFNPQKSQG